MINRGHKTLLGFGQRDTVALTLEDIAQLAFEGSLTAATMFGFVLAHTLN
jgi:hypothetical protein